MYYKGLILLPNLLDDSLPTEGLLPSVLNELQTIDGLLAESYKGGKRYLRRFFSSEKVNQIPLRLLNEHTQKDDVNDLISLLEKGEKWGVISDAGMPCLADPGSQLVFLAHKKNIPVRVISGPSSIFLALALSGFSGQQFCFHGYLPRKQDELEKALKEMEKTSWEKGSTQIWIEAPYRTEKMIQKCITALKQETYLCVASELTLPSEQVITSSIGQWKKIDIQNLCKKRAIFLLQKFK